MRTDDPSGGKTLGLAFAGSVTLAILVSIVIQFVVTAMVAGSSKLDDIVTISLVASGVRMLFTFVYFGLMIGHWVKVVKLRQQLEQAGGRRRDDYDEDYDRPSRRRSSRDYDDEDDRPSRRGRRDDDDDDDDDRPSRRRYD